MGSCYSSMGSKGKDHSHRAEQPTTATSLCLSSTRDTAAATSKRHLWKKKSAGVGGGDHSVLLHIPGRLATNGSTKIACLYTQQGKKGTNQDAMLFWENFSSRTDTVFCGVFDGHGPFGHMVAKKVRDSLPLILCTQWKAVFSSEQGRLCKAGNAPGSKNSDETASISMDDESYDSLDSEETEKLPDIHLPLKKSLLRTFKLMDKELKFHPTIDCFCSGTTAVALIKQGQDLVIGNVGDSRAVLATRGEDNTLLAIQLTVDLKPDLPREAARIQRCKGRVFALQDEPEVARVWLPNNDSPGLAMARALGDFCQKDFGLISVPDVYYHRLTEKDEFIILATDGVWDVLSNKEAVDIVASAPGRATAARALVDCAVRAWRLKYPTSKNDDCAVVCLFLEHVCTQSGEGEEWGAEKIPNNSVENVAKTDENVGKVELHDHLDASRVAKTDENVGKVEMYDHLHASPVENAGSIQGTDEILPASDLSEEKLYVKYSGPSKRSLAECISTAEDEEWSALEGITRVNSLLSLPRLLSGDRRSASWRKWL